MAKKQRGCRISFARRWHRAVLLAFAVFLLSVLTHGAAAQALNYFTDIFSSSHLGGMWHWERETPSMWSLTANPGYLRIYTQEGSLWGDCDPPRNLLLAQISDGIDFQIDVRLFFQPTENFHEAGIAIYKDPSNYVLLGRAFCGRENAACVGDGVYIEHEYCGEMQDDPAPVPWQGDVVCLRVRKQGTTYEFFASEDGESWTDIGTIHGFSIAPTAVGLYAYSELDVDPIPADFDYFRIAPVAAGTESHAEEEQPTSPFSGVSSPTGMPFAMEPAYQVDGLLLASWGGIDGGSPACTGLLCEAMAEYWFGANGYPAFSNDLTGDGSVDERDVEALAQLRGEELSEYYVAFDPTVGIEDCWLLGASVYYFGEAYPSEFRFKVYDDTIEAENLAVKGRSLNLQSYADQGVTVELRGNATRDDFANDLSNGAAIVVGLGDEGELNTYLVGQAHGPALSGEVWPVSFVETRDDPAVPGIQGYVLNTLMREGDRVWEVLYDEAWQPLEFMLSIVPVDRVATSASSAAPSLDPDCDCSGDRYVTRIVTSGGTYTIEQTDQKNIAGVDVYCYTLTNTGPNLAQELLIFLDGIDVYYTTAMPSQLGYCWFFWLGPFCPFGCPPGFEGVAIISEQYNPYLPICPRGLLPGESVTACFEIPTGAAETAVAGELVVHPSTQLGSVSGVSFETAVHQEVSFELDDVNMFEGWPVSVKNQGVGYVMEMSKPGWGELRIEFTVDGSRVADPTREYYLPIAGIATFVSSVPGSSPSSGAASGTCMAMYASTDGGTTYSLFGRWFEFYLDALQPDPWSGDAYVTMWDPAWSNLTPYPFDDRFRFTTCGPVSTQPQPEAPPTPPATPPSTTSCSVTPTSISCGSVEEGDESSWKSFTIENTGDTTISGSITLTGSQSSQFELKTGSTSYNLTSGASKTCYVRFAPSSSGSKSAAVQVGNASSPCSNVSVSGTGTATPPPPTTSCSVSPTSIACGSVEEGDESSWQSFTIENTGDTTISGSITLTGSQASQFELKTGSTSYNLSSGASKTCYVRFTPSSAGSKSATVQVGGTGGPCSNVSVSGTGTTPPPPTYPDLDITSLDACWYNGGVRQAHVRADITVKNKGDATATDVWVSVSVKDSCDAFVWPEWISVGTLTPGQSKTVHYDDWACDMTSCDCFGILVTAEASCAEAESNTSNNEEQLVVQASDGCS